MSSRRTSLSSSAHPTSAHPTSASTPTQPGHSHRPTERAFAGSRAAGAPGTYDTGTYDTGTYDTGTGGLVRYGWTEAEEAGFAPRRDAGLVPARVIRRDRDRCDLITEHGPLTATLGRGLPAGSDPTVCTGDWVVVGTDTADPATAGDTSNAARATSAPAPPGMIVELLPRRSALVRASASRRSDRQVLAANIDLVIVVAALSPEPDLGRLERLLALGWESGAQPLVVLTKADLFPGGTARSDPSAAEMATAAAPGAEVLVVSAVDGTGMDRLRAALAGPSPGGRSAVLVGPSGVGKSTLANALLDTDRFAVGHVRAGDGKGRHTTVRRELVALPSGGVLIDTPGIRGVGLWDSEHGLAETFTEITELAAGCRYRDCGHTAEPGCAVLAAVEDGSLPRRRLASYRKLLRENARMLARSDARLAAEQQRRWKNIHRDQRRFYADRERQGRGR